MMLMLHFLLAHILADFFLQPIAWVKDKEANKLSSRYLYLHVLLHFLLMLLIAGAGHDFDFKAIWLPSAIVAIAHFGIDALKLIFQQERNKRSWFFADQLLHLVSILGVCLLFTNLTWDVSILQNKKMLVYLFAMLFVWKPTSILIKMLIARWTPPTLSGVKPEAELIVEKESLANAGEWIGVLERSLVLIFIWTNHWEAVGFLITAKSVFRFGDIKASREMKLTEYVLIGTLLSFGIAIITGILAMQV